MKTNTLLLVAAGLVGVYLITRKPTVAPPPVMYAPPQPNPYIGIGTGIAQALADVFS
jgi:hypothetical protein